MNGRRATKLRKMARLVVDENTPNGTSPMARARLTEKLARAMRKHWARLNHRQRGRLGVHDVEAGLRGLR